MVKLDILSHWEEYFMFNQCTLLGRSLININQYSEVPSKYWSNFALNMSTHKHYLFNFTYSPKI
jgi:hypothetical protein